MGNALRFLYGQCCSPPPTTTTTSGTGDVTLGYHGVSSSTVCVSVLAQHLYHFEITLQVPEGLSAHVISSKNVQSNWYEKLSKAWRESKPPPTTPEEASTLVVQTLQKNQRPDLEGLLSFYGLPVPYWLDESSVFELHTLPVDVKSVLDGDGLNVFVDTTDARESSLVPEEVKRATVDRSIARKQRNYTVADELHKLIIDKGYRVLNIANEEILARRYRIRLRGIDAPEKQQPYGKEAKDELAKIVNGKCLRILVFYADPHYRLVRDVYCNGLFVHVIMLFVMRVQNTRNPWNYQRPCSSMERMLTKGLAWHFTAYDKHPQLAKWEKDARAKRIGLWALPNPEMPWEWRRNHPESRY